MAKRKPTEPTQKTAAPPPDEVSYFEESRRLGLSIVSILPLVVLYQVAIVQSGSPTRNLAEVWISGPLSLLGMSAAAIMNIIVLMALVFAFWKVHSAGPLGLRFITVMLLESVMYALVLFTGVTVVAKYMQAEMGRYLAIHLPASGSLLLGLGAAVYEELLFRLILVGAGIAILTKACLWNRLLATVTLLTLSSLLFAAAHHVSATGEPFDSFVFTFRTLCGVFLGLVFLLRGLGVAVWTHAIYNVLVLFCS